MRIVPVPAALSALALLLAAPATQAQTVTDEELLKLFQTQRDAFRAAATSGGKTRGLELVTLEDIQVTTDAPGLAQPTVEDGATTVTSVQDTTPETVTPVVFGQLAPEMQVNVQVTFDFDSAALSPEQRPKLAQLCSVMKASDIQLFRVVGHTDAAGSDAYNENLSMLRAQEVMRYFVSDCGIDAARLEAIGLGKRFLLDPANPRAAENRRVEFQALS